MTDDKAKPREIVVKIDDETFVDVIALIKERDELRFSLNCYNTKGPFYIQKEEIDRLQSQVKVLREAHEKIAKSINFSEEMHVVRRLNEVKNISRQALAEVE